MRRSAMKIAALTALSIAPAILLMMTSFSRISVLSFLTQALGTASMPPNQILIGLSLFLTFFTMQPIIDVGYEEAWKPYVAKQINHEQALEKVIEPVRSFMIQQTRSRFTAIYRHIRKNSRHGRGVAFYTFTGIYGK